MNVSTDVVVLGPAGSILKSIEPLPPAKVRREVEELESRGTIFFERLENKAKTADFPDKGIVLCSTKC
jgi:hypothetical protein